MKRKDPLHIRRDNVRDNLTIVRRLRLSRGAQDRAQMQYSIPIFIRIADEEAAPHVFMPRTGSMTVSVQGTNVNPNDLIILNPFVTPTTPVTIQNVNANGGGATRSDMQANMVVNFGRITFSNVTSGTIDGNDGSFIIRVGNATDRRNNGYSQ